MVVKYTTFATVDHGMHAVMVKNYEWIWDHIGRVRFVNHPQAQNQDIILGHGMHAINDS